MKTEHRWLIRYRDVIIDVNRPPKLVSGRLHTSGDWILLVGGGKVSIRGLVTGKGVQAHILPPVPWLGNGNYEKIERFPRWLSKL